MFAALGPAALHWLPWDGMCTPQHRLTPTTTTTAARARHAPASVQAESLATRTRVAFPETADALLPTIADAIRTQPIGDVPWPSVLDFVEPTVSAVQAACPLVARMEIG